MWVHAIAMKCLPFELTPVIIALAGHFVKRKLSCLHYVCSLDVFVFFGFRFLLHDDESVCGLGLSCLNT